MKLILFTLILLVLNDCHAFEKWGAYSQRLAVSNDYLCPGSLVRNLYLLLRYALLYDHL